MADVVLELLLVAGAGRAAPLSRESRFLLLVEWLTSGTGCAPNPDLVGSGGKPAVSVMVSVVMVVLCAREVNQSKKESLCGQGRSYSTARSCSQRV